MSSREAMFPTITPKIILSSSSPPGLTALSTRRMLKKIQCKSDEHTF